MRYESRMQRAKPGRAVMDDLRRYELLFAMRTQEHNWYWQRFTAFATISAALLVLFTSSAITTSGERRVVIAFALLISPWGYIQWASKRFLRQYRDDWMAARDTLFSARPEPRIPLPSLVALAG